MNDSIEIEALCAELGLAPNTIEPLKLNWNSSQETLSDTHPFYLDEPNISEFRSYAGLPAELEIPLQDVAKRIKNDRLLLRLNWHLYASLFIYEDALRQLKDWPTIIPALGEDTGIFYLLVCMAMIPEVKSKHQQLGIPDQITRDTCGQIAAFNENYKGSGAGAAGIMGQQLHWLRHHFDGEIYRVGRFEVMRKKPTFLLRAYEHKRSGEVVVLLPSEQAFNAQGFIVAKESEDVAWTSQLTECDLAVTGNPASPHGYGIPTPRRLIKSEWTCLIDANSVLIDLHIPPGPGLTPQLCHASFQSIFEFFEQYYPGEQVSAIFCQSWIFNTQLEAKLPDSNLANFMRQQYLFPVNFNGDSAFFFVFHKEYEDWTQAPRDTSLKRILLDMRHAGITIRAGGMLFFKQHLSRFGHEPYRNQLKAPQLSPQLNRDEVTL